MNDDKQWLAWEHTIQAKLSLDATPASGARFQAVGDAVDNRHPSESAFPLLADAKHTEAKSYSITKKFWDQWQSVAMEAGKRFIMPIRIWPRDTDNHFPADIVAISLDDFAELLDMALGRTQGQRIEEELRKVRAESSAPRGLHVFDGGSY